MNIKKLFINFSAAELFQLRKPFCELIIVLPPAEMWAKMQAFCRVKHLAESFPLIQNITKPKTLKVCSGCTITSPFQLHKRPLTFPFIPVTFRFWETWPKRSSNPTYSDCLQDNWQKIKKTFLPPDTARKIWYISLKEVCQFCYRAYYQTASGMVKSGWFLLHKGHGNMYLGVHCLFMFFSSQKTRRSIYSWRTWKQ